MGQTPSYIKTLLVRKNGGKPNGRKVWSIDLETIWLPFFTATNVMGDTVLPADALGAPLRLSYNADGSVKFSKTARPIIRVAKDLSDAIRLIRENFTASLQSYAISVHNENRESWQREVDTAKEAGEPILANDRDKLNTAMAQMLTQSLEKAQSEAKAKRKVAKKVATEEPQKVAVTA